jgi:hypothetical protein
VQQCTPFSFSGAKADVVVSREFVVELLDVIWLAERCVLIRWTGVKQRIERFQP